MPETPAAAPPNPAPAPSNGPWYGDLTSNPELKTWTEGKGFANPVVALEAFRNTEKHVGVPADRLIRKPKDASDVEGVKAYRTALGVPEDPNTYEIPVPEGQASTLANWARPVFHKHGLNSDQAKGLATDWNGWLADQVKQAEEADRQAIATAETALRTDWGNEYEARRELGKRAFLAMVEKAGLTDAAAKVEDVLGIPASMKLWHAIGAAMGEGTFKTGGTPPAPAMSPEEAVTKIAQLRGDSEWTKAYLGGDRNKQLEMQRLIAIQTGDTSGVKEIEARMAAR